MKPKIHSYVSKDEVVKSNAFLIETDNELVLVDTTLTMSDSTNLKHVIDGLQKPLAGILITHGHPDHVAGAANIAPNGDVPIYALQSVHDLMKASEQSKHKQWSGLFKSEWIPRWVYPNTVVKGGDSVRVAGLDFQVLDLGAGGDSDANSIWLLDGDTHAAFVGDFVYNQAHTYMMDGSILRWIANLVRLESALAQYQIYVGHGPATDRSGIVKQQAYFATACSCALEATAGTGVFDDVSRRRYQDAMLAKFPGYAFALTVGYSADALGKELAGIKNYVW
ncbi:MAG: MBL fold metallo-hydrolase [Gemmatimonadota bacterium]